MSDDMQDGRLRERRLPGVQSDVSPSDSPVAPPGPKIHRRQALLMGAALIVGTAVGRANGYVTVPVDTWRSSFTRDELL